MTWISGRAVATRPNGKFYRARKPPAVVFYEGDWYSETYVLVIRCSDGIEAERLARAELNRQDSSCTISGRGTTFGWWREVMRNNEPYWEYDSVRGAPGFTFRVE